MDNKKLGIIILIAALVILAVSIVVKVNSDYIINKFISQENTCYLEDGTCLHEQEKSELIYYIVVWVFCAGMIALSIFLIFFEKGNKAINKIESAVSVIEKEKQAKSEEEKFEILMKGLSKEEQKVIKSVREQDGITQQTLRLRTDLHKSKLSIVLDSLEKKGLVARQHKGKTNQVFLKVKL